MRCRLDCMSACDVSVRDCGIGRGRGRGLGVFVIGCARCGGGLLGYVIGREEAVCMIRAESGAVGAFQLHRLCAWALWMGVLLNCSRNKVQDRKLKVTGFQKQQGPRGSTSIRDP